MAYYIAQDECTGCGDCMSECPLRCITRDEETGVCIIDENACISCGSCSTVCPTVAVQKR